ncbi:MAG TPA: IMP dehydrogenase, partial [Anaerolineales bacterium]|nr:IMP dehydrogenase [Anaerolineales bacterium]
MKIRPTKGLTFDDVLLVPRRSAIASRQDVDTTTRLTGSIQMKIPVMSANMDTVTEARMAIAMARAGGIGILHRFMTIEQQIREVKTVKRAQGFIIEHPYNIRPEASLGEARALMDRYKVGALIVMDDTGKLIGLVSQRDLMLAPVSIETI